MLTDIYRFSTQQRTAKQKLKTVAQRPKLSHAYTSSMGLVPQLKPDASYYGYRVLADISTPHFMLCHFGSEPTFLFLFGLWCVSVYAHRYPAVAVSPGIEPPPITVSTQYQSQPGPIAQEAGCQSRGGQNGWQACLLLSPQTRAWPELVGERELGLTQQPRRDNLLQCSSQLHSFIIFHNYNCVIV